jgi:hypothetical protein
MGEGEVLPGFEPPVTTLFPSAHGARVEQDATTSLLYLSEDQFIQLDHFYASVQGDPQYASALFLRMVYFSTTVETTLGFGDITPISEEARIGVTMQAIAGLVFVGLFLNAIWRRRPVNSTGSPDRAEGRLDAGRYRSRLMTRGARQTP